MVEMAEKAGKHTIEKQMISPYANYAMTLKHAAEASNYIRLT